MYLFRARDRRLMEQTERDVALTLQRDYRTFNPKKTTQLSNHVPIYTGWLYTKGNNLNTVLWTSGSVVDCAFLVLEQLLTQLSSGSYQKTPAVPRQNPGVWPVDSINYAWIQALYAFVNPAYAAWATTNNLPLPPGTSSWATAWNSAP